MVFRICVCLWEAGSSLILLIYEAFKKNKKKSTPIIWRSCLLPRRQECTRLWTTATKHHKGRKYRRMPTLRFSTASINTPRHLSHTNKTLTHHLDPFCGKFCQAVQGWELFIFKIIKIIRNSYFISVVPLMHVMFNEGYRKSLESDGATMGSSGSSRPPRKP